jgi:WD40 repeat protein
MSSSASTNLLAVQPAKVAQPVVDQTAQASDDVILEIFSRTSIPAIGALRIVCKRFNQLLLPDNNWQRIFFSLFPNLKLNPSNNFTLACKKQYFLNSNRDKGVFVTSKLLDWGNQTALNGQILLSGNKLCALGNYGEIKVFDIDSNQCINTIQLPRDNIDKAFLWNGKLVIKFPDNDIDIWNLEGFNCEHRLLGHSLEKDAFSSMTDQGELICISPDRRLKIVDLNTRNSVGLGPFSLNINGDVFSCASHGRKVYLGSEEGEIKIWDLEEQKQTGQLNGHDTSVNVMTVSNGKLYSIAKHEMKIWNLTSNACESTSNLADSSDGNDRPIVSMQIVDDMLICALGGDVILWDLVSNKRKAKIKGNGLISSLKCVNDGRIFTGSHHYAYVKVWDLAAEDKTVLNEIINRLGYWNEDSYDPDAPAEAMARFSKMPPHIKEKVYTYLYETFDALGLLDEEYYVLDEDYYEGIAEDVFHNQLGQHSTNDAKIRAIKRFLASKKAPPPLPKKPLLVSFGIVSKEQYSEKLKCRPEFLRQIGLLSSQDLETICSFSPEIAALPIEQAVGDETNFREKSVKAKADNRRIALSGLIDQMCQKVNKNIVETKQCGVLLYEGEMPWIGFETKLNAFQAKLAQIVDGCNGSPALIVKAFQSSEYNILAEELNALVEEFKKLDNEHQVAKLSAYINQFGILKAWEELHKQETFKLSSLPAEEKSLDRLFQMGQ